MFKRDPGPRNAEAQFIEKIKNVKRNQKIIKADHQDQDDFDGIDANLKLQLKTEMNNDLSQVRNVVILGIDG